MLDGWMSAASNGSISILPSPSRRRIVRSERTTGAILAGAAATRAVPRWPFPGISVTVHPPPMVLERVDRNQLFRERRRQQRRRRRMRRVVLLAVVLALALIVA